MRAKSAFRDREPAEVAVLDALVNRTDDGMTVFELRAAVDIDIDELEDALADLKEDGLIDIDRREGRTVITPAEQVLPDDPAPNNDESLLDWIREKIPF